MKQVFLPVLLATLSLNSCTKDGITDPASSLSAKLLSKGGSEPMTTGKGNLFTWYDTLASNTLWELQQARAATAKYKDLKNALADGYQDIEIDVEHMGHHYMNTSLVDSVVDFKNPEILVYNRTIDGTPVLVAIEYAVPISLPKPEGFSGADDIRNGNSPFPLWLLHAWVWAYNPEGVFNWTNPLIHLN